MLKKFDTLSDHTLGPYNKIVFGPFLGSFEYELLFWRGYVQKYIKAHPEKNVVISTRFSRRDLYSGFNAIMSYFELDMVSWVKEQRVIPVQTAYFMKMFDPHMK